MEIEDKGCLLILITCIGMSEMMSPNDTGTSNLFLIN